MLSELGATSPITAAIKPAIKPACTDTTMHALCLFLFQVT